MKRMVLALAVVSGCVVSLLVGVGGAVGSLSTAAVTRAPRVPRGARAIGRVPASSAQTATVVLRPRDQVAVVRFIGAVTDVNSPLFHHYLAPGQYRDRFGPRQSTIDAVTSQLRTDGLRVTGVASDGLFVDVRGSAAAVERAFGTRLERYRLASGSVGQATTSAVRLPSSIANDVTSVLGLNSTVRLQPTDLVWPRASARGSYPPAKAPRFAHPAGSPTPCSAAGADAERNGGLTDDEIAHAYGAFGLYGAGDLGAGQHIAVYELEPFLASDVRAFDTCYFGAKAAAQMAKRLKVIPVDGGVQTGPGSGEAALDVQDLSALAPRADIDVYEGPYIGAAGDEYDPVDEYVPMVDRDVDRVISSSWGLCEQSVQLGQPGLQAAENLLFEQAAAQGQSIFNAAGDTGSDDCNELRPPSPVSGQNPVSVMDPGSQPDVVAVGGTTIDDATEPPLEHVWNDGANGGAGGGGISMSWEMPAWQRDSRVPGVPLPGSSDYAQANKVEKQFGYPQNFCQAYLPAATSSTPCRTLPDVSAQADEYTGSITIYYSGAWYTIGGTSSATPIWAAMLALVNESPTCRGNAATKRGVGFVNPLLYAVASSPAAYAASFNDITTGNNDIYTLDNGQVFPARTGYDLASGLGSPQVTARGDKAGLAYYLCSYGASASRPKVTKLAPRVLSTAGGSVTITGSGFKPSGGADVAGIQVGTWQIPASKFTVTSNTSITATFPPAKDTVPPDAPRPQDGAGPAEVIVTLKGGQSSVPGPRSTLEYVDEHSSSPVPSVTGVVPYGGSESSPAPVRILGSGFTGATKVTFGGVPAKSIKVVSPFRIIATPPAYSPKTKCSPLPKKGVYAGENATNDICQVQLQVTGAHGASALGHILPPYEGAFAINPMADQVAPPHCGCEISPVPTEYDYAPKPSISSVSTSVAKPSSLASEKGTSVVTIRGKGFNTLSIDWVNFGPARLESSQDFSYVSVTGTQLQIIAPAQSLTTQPLTLPLSVRTLAGLSAPSKVTYAGIPVVTSALNTATNRNGAADTGGAPMTLSGHGFKQAVGPLQFDDVSHPSTSTTQFTYTVNSDTSISTHSPASAAGLDDVEVCSVTGCAANPTADYFYLYPPGNPKVTSVTPSSGPASGGTKVVIRGQNLGCVTAVYFGTAVAERFSNKKAILDCGSTNEVDATSPPGAAGSTVNVTVTTIESEFTGSGPSSSTALFRYTK